jgi:hypothetical protein
MKNKQYRYSFSIKNNYDYPSGCVFLSDKEYTNKEFINICTSVIKKIFFNNLNNMKIKAIGDNFDLLTNYEHCPNSYYLVFDNYEPQFNDDMEKLGFKIENLDTKASFDINNYTFIKDYFHDEIIQCLENRQKQENIPIINDEHDICVKHGLNTYIKLVHGLNTYIKSVKT